MACDIVIPRLNPAMGRVTLVTWVAGEGEEVGGGDALYRMHDGRAEHCVKAPKRGVVRRDARAGAELDAGAVIGRLDPVRPPVRASIEVELTAANELVERLADEAETAGRPVPQLVHLAVLAVAVAADEAGAGGGTIRLRLLGAAPDATIASGGGWDLDRVVSLVADSPQPLPPARVPGIEAPAPVELVWAAHLGVDHLEPRPVGRATATITVGRERTRVAPGRWGKARATRVAMISAVADPLDEHTTAALLSRIGVLLEHPERLTTGAR